MLVENDTLGRFGKYAVMGKDPENDVHDSELDEDRLYIGEWLAAMGIKPARVSDETGINAGYLSHLISRKKDKPSRAILLKIGRFIGVDWHLLYEKPPTRATIDQVAKYGPGLLERLSKPKRQ